MWLRYNIRRGSAHLQLEDVTYLQQSVLKTQMIYFKTKNGTMQAAHEAEGSEMRSRVEQLENIVATMQCQISRLQETCGLNIQQGHQGLLVSPFYNI